MKPNRIIPVTIAFFSFSMLMAQPVHKQVHKYDKEMYKAEAKIAKEQAKHYEKQIKWERKAYEKQMKHRGKGLKKGHYKRGYAYPGYYEEVYVQPAPVVVPAPAPVRSQARPSVMVSGSIALPNGVLNVGYAQ